MKNYNKYKRLYDWKKPFNRTWMDKQIENAPIWCSVDLRDGNQALANPMNLHEKVRFFKYLVSIGFKEIEIGFPAASETEYNFTRYLIENNLIPDDVTIQVLTQAREDIVSKTFEALEGVKRAIVHVYNSVSKVQREVVFNKSKEEVKDIALEGAKLVLEYSSKYPSTEWQFEYSPESFTNAEVDYAIEVVNAVLDVWKDVKVRPIINFPATVECSMPNVFADQIEYVCENIKNRDNVIISVHPHNDRGTGVASSEMALLAGADRLEGTLFGNGERTGNADIMNIAMNMYVLGVDPKLDFSNILETKSVYEDCTKMVVSPRHPYAGEFVFTAFSGSHQDAISKGLKNITDNYSYWEVPYLPLNPADINRQYEPIIRINSQSGKGGVSFVIEHFLGYSIPKLMQKEIGVFFKKVSDDLKRELLNDEIVSKFIDEFQNRTDFIRLKKYFIENGQDETLLKIQYVLNDELKECEMSGNGPIDAFVNVLREDGFDIEIDDYTQQSLNENGKKSHAISYVNIRLDDKNIWAIGKDSDIIKSGFKAIISALNRK